MGSGISAEEVDSKIDSKITTLDLTDYVKKTDLTDYAKTEDLTDYAKTEDLTGYAKTADLTGYAKTADLTGYAKTKDLPAIPDTKGFLKSSDLKQIYEGSSVRCETGGQVYRVVDGKLRHYVSGDIAKTWDDQWVYAQRVPCKNLGLVSGEDMVAKTS